MTPLLRIAASGENVKTMHLEFLFLFAGKSPDDTIKTTVSRSISIGNAVFAAWVGCLNWSTECSNE